MTPERARPYNYMIIISYLAVMQTSKYGSTCKKNFQERDPFANGLAQLTPAGLVVYVIKPDFFGSAKYQIQGSGPQT